MSQEDLSKALNLSRSSLSNIEIGRHQIPLIVLYELSKILSLDLHKLIPTLIEVEDSVDQNNNHQELLLSGQLDDNQFKHILNQIKKIKKK